MLTLFEELYLLTVREEPDTANPQRLKKLRHVMAGAVLAELALSGKLQVSHNHRLELFEPANTGDEILDQAQRALQGSEQPHKVAYWVEALQPKPKRFLSQLSNRLVDKGIFELEEDHLHWAIPSQPYQNRVATAKYCIKVTLRDIVLANCEPFVRPIALLSLLKAARLSWLVFTEDERREANKRIHQILVSEALKNPAAQTIEEIQEAVATFYSR